MSFLFPSVRCMSGILGISSVVIDLVGPTKPLIAARANIRCTLSLTKELQPAKSGHRAIVYGGWNLEPVRSVPTAQATASEAETGHMFCSIQLSASLAACTLPTDTRSELLPWKRSLRCPEITRYLVSNSSSGVFMGTRR